MQQTRNWQTINLDDSCAPLVHRRFGGLVAARLSCGVRRRNRHSSKNSHSLRSKLGVG